MLIIKGMKNKEKYTQYTQFFGHTTVIEFAVDVLKSHEHSLSYTLCPVYLWYSISDSLSKASGASNLSFFLTIATPV